jgi:hypothetical protein
MEFKKSQEVEEYLEKVLLPACNNEVLSETHKMRSDISKLKKHVEELELALKYISGSPEYQKAYQEFKELDKIRANKS